MIAGWSNKVEYAPMIFKGCCNTEVVLSWLEYFLIPELKPNQIVVMDNASFHKSPTIRELIERAGCFLWFLPPYSPDFNPIERHWANLKEALKKLNKPYLHVQQQIELLYNNFIL